MKLSTELKHYHNLQTRFWIFSNIQVIIVKNYNLLMNHPVSTDTLKAQFLAQFDAAESAIHERFVELQAKYDDLQRMRAQFDANFVGGKADRLDINCGGCEINVQRGVLTQFKRTGLAALFCGRYDNDIDRDQKNRIFLDLDPNAFYALIEYLTAVQEGRAKVGRTDLMASEDQHANIDALIDHFKLRPYLTGVVRDDDAAHLRRRNTVIGASERPSIDEIRERSENLRPLIDAFQDYITGLFQEERRVAKWEAEGDWENLYEFDRYFAELYKKKDTDPIDFVNSLDVQFMCKRSTMKLSEFLYNLQRNRRGEVILTNPSTIVGKILEYLRRRKIRLDDNHVGDLYVEENEWQFFHDTVKSFGILEDLKLRADLKKYKKGSRPIPMKLALPSSTMVGHIVGQKKAEKIFMSQHLNDQEPPRAPPPPQTSNSPNVRFNPTSTAQQPNFPQQFSNNNNMGAYQQHQQRLQQGYQQPARGIQRPEGWTAQQWSQYQANHQTAYMEWYQKQQQKQYGGMSPQEAWSMYYAAQARGNQS